MLRLIFVGKMKNKALFELASDYLCRLQKYDKVEVVELKDAKDANIQKEGERILEALKSTKGKIYILSEEGKAISSTSLSEMLEKDLACAGNSTFVIGGAYGLSEDVKARANILLSLSQMTFTHEWARAILCEQLYRAKSISAGSGYHH